MYVCVCVARTLQVVGLTAVLSEPVHEEREHRSRSPRCGRPALPALVVQQHGVALAAADEALLVGVVGDDGADGQIAFAQAAEHEARDGEVDGGLDVRGLVKLVRAAVEQEQRVEPGLQLVLQPCRTFPPHQGCCWSIGVVEVEVAMLEENRILITGDKKSTCARRGFGHALFKSQQNSQTDQNIRVVYNQHKVALSRFHMRAHSHILCPSRSLSVLHTPSARDHENPNHPALFLLQLEARSR